MNINLEKMKKILVIILTIIVISFLGIKGYQFTKGLIQSYQKFESESHFYDPENFFADQKVVELCQASKIGDIAKMDDLVRQGVNINTVGKNGMTPFLWAIRFSGIHNSDILKKVFQWFVDHRANPVVVYHWKGNAYYTVFHTTAESPDIFYLKTLLESGLIKDIDMELPENANPTALLQAELSDRFDNFKLLLDYGADINKEIGEDNLKDATLNLVEGNMSWHFAYELLKRGANFNTNMRDGKSEIVRIIEDIVFRPSVSLNYRGVDWRQKCVEFLEKHGVPKIHPWMPDDEKYVKENGKYQLYINEKYHFNKETRKMEQVSNEDKWVKFEESYKYKPEKDNGVYGKYSD